MINKTDAKRETYQKKNIVSKFKFSKVQLMSNETDNNYLDH